MKDLRMKALYIIIAASIITFLKCTSAANLADDWKNTISNTAGEVTKVVQKVSAPIANATGQIIGTASTFIGAIRNTSSNVASGIASTSSANDGVSTVSEPTQGTSDGLLNALAAAGGQLLGTPIGIITGLASSAADGINAVALTSGQVAGSLFSLGGNFFSTVFGTGSTNGKMSSGLVHDVNGVGVKTRSQDARDEEDYLESLKISTKTDTPLRQSVLVESNYLCISQFLREFQIYSSELVKIVCNAYHLTEHYCNFHNYCTTRSTLNEINNCLDILRQTSVDELNTGAIDVTGVKVNYAGEWMELITKQIHDC